MKKPTDLDSATAAALDTKTSWTIMLYIAADDTLANFAVESLKQLNKSMSTPSNDKDEASVIVAAQFGFPFNAAKATIANAETSGNQRKRRYIFKKGKARSLAAHEVHSPPALAHLSQKSNLSDKAIVSEKEALKDFLTSVYTNAECNKSDHYALILWGHGPELLLQPPASNPTGDRNSLYLTPGELREALTASKPPNSRHLDIIGFDACSMSMFEMAFELKGSAHFMVASQEDVPDLSFPYDDLIGLFRKRGDNLASLLREGVKTYVKTYQGCVCNINTGMKPVTLTVLDLDNCTLLERGVGSLACALLKAKDDACLADLLIEARKSSQDYAGGLYVDLHDFCTKLSGQLSETNAGDKWKNIQSACQKVLDELTKGTSKFIVENSGNNRGHGISIYLPYLTDEQFNQVNRPLAKGGIQTVGKGFSEAINGAATEYLMCARRNLILNTESYYERLQLSETHWYDFIAEQWTRALIKNFPAELDYHYSAQQSWINLFRKSVDISELREPGVHLTGQPTGAV